MSVLIWSAALPTIQQHIDQRLADARLPAAA